MEFLEENSNVISNPNKAVTKVFFRMFLGILATAITAMISYTSGLYLELPYQLIAIVELAIVIIFSFLFKKLSPAAVTCLFFIYAFVNGLTMAVIFAVFDISTIAYAFGATALLFGTLAFVGYTTKIDMSKFGNIFLIALVVGLVVSLINLFIGCTMIDIILDWVMLLVFCGLTAYDMYKMRILQEQIGCEDEKLYVYCAMDLYLDFINIFLRILSIMGRRRD